MPDNSLSPVLTISDLTIAYRYDTRLLDAVRDFSLQIEAGQTCGLIGESGSGKSTIVMAVMRYLPPHGVVRRGEIMVEGRSLLSLSPAQMRDIWGTRLNLVPQDPLSSLNPSILIGEQLAEGLRYHLQLSRKSAALRAIDLLNLVRVPDPQRVAQSYPHQISGGMQQRVLIALAIGTEPKLLVLDEPTTSLDVTTQAAVLDLLADLISSRQTAVLYVTHNSGVVARICRRVVVLYAGELVEDAPVMTVYQKPLHPYTRALLNSVPEPGKNKETTPLPTIPGRIPSLFARSKGCVFAPRCLLAIQRCFDERPSLDEPFAGHRVRCHRWAQIAGGEISADLPVALPSSAGTSWRVAAAGKSVLNLQEVSVLFKRQHSVLNRLIRRTLPPVKAVDGVNLHLTVGRTLGLVGESGSGKTTLARMVMGLVEPTGGRIDLFNVPLPPQVSARTIETLRHVQYVFQNPEEAMNPYLTIGEALKRPFISLLGKSSREAEVEARKLLTAVGLSATYLARFPSQLSGGEKQRIAIARAFASSPDLLIADEPVSSLDVSVQAAILNLLNTLQLTNHNSMVLISHDLAVVGYLADCIAVMYLGQLMEVTDSKDLFHPPFHPYTEALLSAILPLYPAVGQTTLHLAGETPEQLNPSAGCPFYFRCPYRLKNCHHQTPPWQNTANGKRIFCHILPDDLYALQKNSVVLKESSAAGEQFNE